MPVHCSMVTLAEYASASADGKLMIAGTIDSVRVEPRRTLTAGDELPPIPLPRMFLVFVATASIADGLQHTFSIGLRHEDGKFVFRDASECALTFKVNPKGRPMRAQTIVELNGVVAPAFGDYEFVIEVDGHEVCASPFYVDGSQDR